MSVDKCQQSINMTSIGKQDFEVWGESQTETDSLEGNCQRPAISSPDIPTQEGIRKEKSEEKKISFRYGQILHYLQYPIHHLPLVTFCSDSIYLLYLMTSKISITLVDLRAGSFMPAGIDFRFFIHSLQCNKIQLVIMKWLTWRYQNYLFKNYLGFERRSETWEPFKSDKQLCPLWSQTWMFLTDFSFSQFCILNAWSDEVL